MLIKNHEERREIVTLDATIKILNLIKHTISLTEADWLKDEIKDSIKGSLFDFIDFVRDNRIIGWLGELKEFGYIQEFCDGKINMGIKSLQEYLAVIKDSLFQKVKH